MKLNATTISKALDLVYDKAVTYAISRIASEEIV